MGFNLKAYLQKQVIEGEKKKIIKGLKVLRLSVLEGYTIKSEDVDKLFIALKLSQMVSVFVAPFLVGLNLRNLVGSYDDAAIEKIDDFIIEVMGWRL